MLVQADINQKKYMIIAATLALHLAILSLLFIHINTKIKELPSSVKNPENQIDELKKDWAARQPPVIFYDEPEEIAQEQQLEPEIQTADAPPAQHIIKEVAEPQEEVHNEPIQETKSTIIERIIEKAAEKVTKVEEKKEVKKTAAAPPAKRKINLADIAHSFMEKMDNIPMGTLFMQGAADKLPPDKQISFERYRQKVGAIIEQVYNAHPFPINNLPVGTAVQMYLALDKSGRFKDIHVSQASGIPAVDDYCMFIYTEASKQFPPIPDSLEESLFKGYIRLYSYRAKPGEKTRGNWFLFQ